VGIALAPLDKPMQRGFIERFNRTFREAVLHICFQSLDEVRAHPSNRSRSTIKNDP
jgi:hypothetical protein